MCPTANQIRPRLAGNGLWLRHTGGRIERHLILESARLRIADLERLRRRRRLSLVRSSLGASHIRLC